MRERSNEGARPIEREPGSERPAPQGREAEAAESRAGAKPYFRELDERECEELLERNHVGRIAYTFRDRVNIRAVHYVKHEHWLYGRTSAGEKLDVLHRSRWIAFEVDEVRGVFDWRSVVVHGAFYVLDPDGADDEKEAWARGLELIRTIVPEAGTSDDPVPHRDVLFRIHIDQVTGREAKTGRATEREVPLE